MGDIENLTRKLKLMKTSIETLNCEESANVEEEEDYWHSYARMLYDFRNYSKQRDSLQESTTFGMFCSL